MVSLNVTGCKKLEELDCTESDLTSLDMSGFASLRDLICMQCELTSLDVTGCTKLENLYCMKNSLTSMDISSCISLKVLYCSDNPLASLDVSFCPNLTDINADESTTILTTHEHVWNEGVVTKEATTTEERVKTYKLDGLLKLIDVIDTLCDGQISRDEIPKALKVNTLTGKGSLEEVRLAISLALIQSMSIPDENDDGSGNGTGIMEIPKFIVIATSKFHFNEKEAWVMTPRKFSLLNDAYCVVNGLKKEVEYASLLALP